MAQIDKLYAWVSTVNDEQGIVAGMRGLVMTPLVYSDPKLEEPMKVLAQSASNHHGVSLELIEFSRSQVVDTVSPKEQ